MKVVTGHFDLSSVTMARSSEIDVSRNADWGDFNLWSHVHGDFGVTGASVYLTWEGCYTRSGSTYVTPTGTNKIRTSGTSVTGPDGNGTDSATFAPDIFPFIRITAVHDSSASTRTAGVTYALMFN
jgi:hypothetical protein